MELKRYLATLWRRKSIILIVAVVTVAVVTVGTFQTTLLYQTSTTLRVATTCVGTVDTLNYDNNYADRLMKTHSQAATSSPMLGELSQKIRTDALPKIACNRSPNTELIHMTAEDQHPLLGQTPSNTLAELLIAYARNLAVQGDEKKPPPV